MIRCGVRLLLAALTLVASASSQTPAHYPPHWWSPVHDEHKPEWEILPQAAKPGEVILSKRNELGILSNFAPTPFTLRGKRYASVEGFWQMMLYPEDASDPRAQAAAVSWRYTREQVSQMTSFEAKEAGTLAEENMRKLGVDWVTFDGKRMPYRSMTKGEHYRLIREAMVAKLEQNSKVREILLSTGDLILRPDHIQEPNAPPEWAYFDLWMEIRSDLQKHSGTSSLGDVEFSDKPDFVVAGVKETAYTGGHGSDAGARSTEALSKATASLKAGSQSDADQAGKREVALRMSLAQHPNDANLHSSLATIEEQLGKPLEAVHEYQRATELQASEGNLFDWGTELLLHDAPQAASDVFEKGMKLYPNSLRLWLGAAVAAYAQSQYSVAAQRFFHAIDINPMSPEPYRFLADVQAPEISDTDGYRERLTRFVQLRPESAWANYLYAATIWDPKSETTNRDTLARAQSALEKAVRLDPALAPAWLELGTLYSKRGNFMEAADAYRKAIATDPTLEQAHYRLAAAYRKLGDPINAERETALFEQLMKNSTRAREQERSNLQRFVVELKDDRADH